MTSWKTRQNNCPQCRLVEVWVSRRIDLSDGESLTYRIWKPSCVGLGAQDFNTRHCSVLRHYGASATKSMLLAENMMGLVKRLRGYRRPVLHKLAELTEYIVASHPRIPALLVRRQIICFDHYEHVESFPDMKPVFS